MESKERTEVSSNVILLWFLVPMLVVVVVGTTVLIYQCKRLYTVLKHEPSTTTRHGKTTKKNKSDRSTKNDNKNDESQRRIQDMNEMRKQARMSAQRTQAQLQEELRSVSQMQVEVSSQLILLKQVLGQWREQERKSSSSSSSSSCRNDGEVKNPTVNNFDIVQRDCDKEELPDKKED